MAQLPMLGDNGYVVSSNLQTTWADPRALQPLGRTTRRHPNNQIRKLKSSLTQFGFRLPILIDGQSRVVAGFGLVLAALQLNLRRVPVIKITDLKEPELRALRLAMNKLGEESSWVTEELSLEFREILELDDTFDIQVSGFEMGEIDRLTLSGGADEEDEFLPEVTSRTRITNLGDVWVLGNHRILCGDARDRASFEAVMLGETAQMVFTDPPYNVPIDGNVSGLGAVKHVEFAMVAGEMSDAEYTGLGRMASSVCPANMKSGPLGSVLAKLRSSGWASLTIDCRQLGATGGWRALPRQPAPRWTLLMPLQWPAVDMTRGHLGSVLTSHPTTTPPMSATPMATSCTSSVVQRSSRGEATRGCLKVQKQFRRRKYSRLKDTVRNSYSRAALVSQQPLSSLCQCPRTRGILQLGGSPRATRRSSGTMSPSATCGSDGACTWWKF